MKKFAADTIDAIAHRFHRHRTMTASDIIYIVTTVAVVQGVCDALANRFTFSTDVYQRKCAILERAKINLEKTKTQIAQNPIIGNSNSSAKAKDKQAKKLQRAEEDYQTAASNVSLKHVAPNVFNGVVFFLLYRILNIEYQGKIIAVLPFTPWRFIQRFITMRGLEFQPDFIYEGTQRVKHTGQFCNFLFVYMLATMSVKFMVKQAIGAKPPTGADKGLLNLLDDPRGQKFLKSVGFDENNLNEINEMRKSM